MIGGWRRVLAVMVLATAPLACGRTDGPPLYPVHGKVMFNGQPAVGATVYLRREGPAPPKSEAFGDRIPSGRVDEEGNFWIRVDEYGDGAPVGDYKALIAWRVKEEGGAPVAPQATNTKKKKGRKAVAPDKPDFIPDRLGERYMQPDRSPFVVQVKAEDNALQPFDVSVSK
jgi:hypothetical protein